MEYKELEKIAMHKCLSKSHKGVGWKKLDKWTEIV